MKAKETAKYVLFQLPDGNECKSKASLIAVGWRDSTPRFCLLGTFCSLGLHLEENIKISHGVSTTRAQRVCTFHVIIIKNNA